MIDVAAAIAGQLGLLEVVPLGSSVTEVDIDSAQGEGCRHRHERDFFR
ncbi:MAG: hypothetical protein ACLT98_15555 [Eggerthellaceae bacterium]